MPAGVELEFEMSMVDTALSIGEPINVTVTLTNIGMDSVNISEISIYVNSLDFEIHTPEGYILYYSGPMVEHLPFAIELLPGDSITETYNLREIQFGDPEQGIDNYGFNTTGTYTVRGLYRSWGPEVTWEGELSSSMLQFTIMPAGVELEFEISMPDTELFVGEPINVDITLTNTGTAAVSISEFSLPAGSLDFKIHTPEGYILHYSGPIVLTWPPIVELLPGESIAQTYNLREIQFGAKSGIDYYDFNTTGTYTVQALYSSWGPGVTWEGELQSAVLEFTLHAQPPQPGEPVEEEEPEPGGFIAGYDVIIVAGATGAGALVAFFRGRHRTR
jgi:hypothetical protein